MVKLRQPFLQSVASTRRPERARPESSEEVKQRARPESSEELKQVCSIPTAIRCSRGWASASGCRPDFGPDERSPMRETMSFQAGVFILHV